MSADPRFYDFGPYRLDMLDHVLLRGNNPVALTPKAFDTLVVLVRNSGRVVEKGELLKAVWPETFVEEATLAQNIFTLRRALETDDSAEYIRTIPKRGYRFMLPVTQVPEQSATESQEQAEEQPAQSRIGKAAESEILIRSLAVLPLENATADPTAEYLTDGITESLVNSLSWLPDLKIKACGSVHAYKGRRLAPQNLVYELGVDAVLVGKILQFGEIVFVRMELIDGQGWQLWGKEYREKFSNLYKFQDRMAKHISDALRLKLTSDVQRRLFKPRAHSAEAYQHYLKGRYFLNMRTKEGYEKAIDLFEQAIEVDPNFALAYSGLADSYIRFDFYGMKPPWETVPKARSAATRAVELNNELAEAHTSRAVVRLVYDRDLVGAERGFKRAIRLNPKYARAHDGYAQCLIEMHRTNEAFAESAQALDLEPLDPEINQHLGWHYLSAHEYDTAIEQLKRTLALSPNFYRARLLLGIAYGQNKQFQQAIIEFRRAQELEKTSVLSAFLAYAYAMIGNDEALKILEELLERAKTRYVPPYCFALIYTGLGREDEAIDWLQMAFVEQSHWRGWLNITPEFDRLLAHPRFTELLQQRLRHHRL
jgi:DNA-binding winged helix-turn-helix (wHTH) protein/tetratricopeptide (TPR) repeat protein